MDPYADEKTTAALEHIEDELRRQTEALESIAQSLERLSAPTNQPGETTP